MARSALQTAKAFATACLAAAACASIPYVTASFLTEPIFYTSPPFRLRTPITFAETIFFNFVVGAMMSAIVGATIGLGWHRIALSKNCRGALAYWLPGLIVGATAYLLMVAMRGGMTTWPLLILWGATLGGFTGAFFWLIRRPDRDAPPNPPTSTP
jgi:hypothetical protein